MSDEGNSDEGKTDVAERIIIDTLIELTDELINGLEQRTFMTEQELSLLNEKSHGEKSKHLIQLPLDEMLEVSHTKCVGVVGQHPKILWLQLVNYLFDIIANHH